MVQFCDILNCTTCIDDDGAQFYSRAIPLFPFFVTDLDAQFRKKRVGLPSFLVAYNAPDTLALPLRGNEKFKF